MSPWEFLLFTLPPSVENCEATSTDSYGHVEFGVDLGLHLNLKSQSLQNSAIGAGYLSKLLKYCPKLENLDYSNNLAVEAAPVFDPPLLMSGLLCLTRTLKRLDLSDGDWVLDDIEDVKLGSFKAFKVLTHLSLWSGFLLGINNADLTS